MDRHITLPLARVGCYSSSREKEKEYKLLGWAVGAWEEEELDPQEEKEEKEEEKEEKEEE